MTRAATDASDGELGVRPEPATSGVSWRSVALPSDWYAHTGDLTDFWAGILLGEPHDPADEVIESHRWLHEADPFDTALFDRRLEILDTTLTDGWRGPMTETARRRGHGIAWAMSKRLTGHGTRPVCDGGSR